MKLRISSTLWKKIEKHARDSFPRECVGFYSGTLEKVDRVYPFKNIAEDKETSSEIKKSTLKKLTASAYKLNEQLGEPLFWFGQYHSHPTSGKTIQSKLDKEAGTKWLEYRKQLILGIKKKDGQVRKKFYYYDLNSKSWKEGKIVVSAKKP